jgi:hypothetical protein
MQKCTFGKEIDARSELRWRVNLRMNILLFTEPRPQAAPVFVITATLKTEWLVL